MFRTRWTPLRCEIDGTSTGGFGERAAAHSGSQLNSLARLTRKCVPEYDAPSSSAEPSGESYVRITRSKQGLTSGRPVICADPAARRSATSSEALPPARSAKASGTHPAPSTRAGRQCPSAMQAEAPAPGPSRETAPDRMSAVQRLMETAAALSFAAIEEHRPPVSGRAWASPADAQPSTSHANSTPRTRRCTELRRGESTLTTV